MARARNITKISKKGPRRIHLLHSGLSRVYYEPLKESDIPTLEDLVDPLKVKKYEHFINFVTSNHKIVNWWYYRHHITEENYRLYLYSFAVIIGTYDTGFSAVWQVDNNARRLKKSLAKLNIDLSYNEQKLLELIVRFSEWTAPSKVRANTSETYKKALAKQYLG